MSIDPERDGFVSDVDMARLYSEMAWDGVPSSRRSFP
jgi:hypothetical protein